jgi:hypothetical protein
LGLALFFILINSFFFFFLQSAAEIAQEKALDVDAIAHDCKREGDKTLAALGVRVSSLALFVYPSPSPRAFPPSSR